MINKALYSTGNIEHETPDDLFNELDEEFNFNLDTAATAYNTKCYTYYDVYQDGLNSPWLGNVFCNPPYGRDVGKWVKKAHNEFQKGNADLIVMLLPSRTDTKWFHDYIYNQTEIRFVKGRLKFKGTNNSAPFPSMIVIWKRK